MRLSTKANYNVQTIERLQIPHTHTRPMCNEKDLHYGFTVHSGWRCENVTVFG